jgi:hypothetical protein
MWGSPVKEYWYTAQQVAGTEVAEVCHKMGIGEHTFYVLADTENRPLRWAISDTLHQGTDGGADGKPPQDG